MAIDSHIEWTESTWNPVTGCSKVSAGCAHCYAERMAKRLQAMGNPRYQNAFNLTLHPDLLDLPRTWKTPRRIFVNSMSDLFHEQVPDEFLDRVFAVMALTPHITYQVLTKRPERMRAYPRIYRDHGRISARTSIGHLGRWHASPSSTVAPSAAAHPSSSPVRPTMTTVGRSRRSRATCGRPSPARFVARVSAGESRTGYEFDN